MLQISDKSYSHDNGMSFIIQDLIADPNYNIDEFFRPSVINEYRATCLGHAIDEKNIDLVNVCLKRGANPNLGALWYKNGIVSSMKHPVVLAASNPNDSTLEILKALISSGTTPTKKDVNEMLHKTVWPLNLGCMKWSLENGADPNYQSSPGHFTSLMLLCYRWNETQHEDYVRAAALLICVGVNLDIKASGCSGGPKDWKGHLAKELPRSWEEGGTVPTSEVLYKRTMNEIETLVKSIDLIL